MFDFTISASLYVRSSSEREPASTATEGLTGGGGTGRAVSSIQSGLERAGSKPRARQSASEMRRRISCAFSALSSWRLSMSGGRPAAASSSMPSALGLSLGNSAQTRGPSMR